MSGEEFNIKNKVQEVIKILDELEEFENNIPTNQANVDLTISDLYHLLENQKLKTSQCYRFVKKLKEVLDERRKLKERTELIRTFNMHQNKLNNSKNRQMLLSELGKREKQLKSEYKYRILSEEDINEIMK